MNAKMHGAPEEHGGTTDLHPGRTTQHTARTSVRRWPPRSTRETAIKMGQSTAASRTTAYCQRRLNWGSQRIRRVPASIAAASAWLHGKLSTGTPWVRSGRGRWMVVLKKTCNANVPSMDAARNGMARPRRARQ